MEYWRLNRIKQRDPTEHQRTVANLIELRKQLDEDVPPKNAESDLLLATWNIRDLAKNNRKGYGERFPESHFYIAEVLSRFDFIAVQEVNELDEWREIVDILGERNWSWIATDVTYGAGGNGERLTYLWDKRKVNFQNVAGELVLPTELLITKYLDPKVDENADGVRDEPDPGNLAEIDGKPIGQQFRRTPFAALFQAGWFKFEICTAHLYFGEEDGNELKERVQEIERIAQFFGKRGKTDLAEDRSLILLGDFNIVSREHETMKKLIEAGFMVPDALTKAPPTNSKKTMYYDQIVFQANKGELDYLNAEAEGAAGRAGTVEIFKRLYTPDQRPIYRSQMETASGFDNKKAVEDPDWFFSEWRTYQFSDHFPLWVQLKVDDSSDYLTSIHAPNPK